MKIFQSRHSDMESHNILKRNCAVLNGTDFSSFWISSQSQIDGLVVELYFLACNGYNLWCIRLNWLWTFRCSMNPNSLLKIVLRKSLMLIVSRTEFDVWEWTQQKLRMNNKKQRRRYNVQNTKVFPGNIGRILCPWLSNSAKVVERFFSYCIKDCVSLNYFYTGCVGGAYASANLEFVKGLIDGIERYIFGFNKPLSVQTCALFIVSMHGLTKSRLTTHLKPVSRFSNPFQCLMSVV